MDEPLEGSDRTLIASDQQYVAGGVDSIQPQQSVDRRGSRAGNVVCGGNPPSRSIESRQKIDGNAVETQARCRRRTSQNLRNVQSEDHHNICSSAKPSRSPGQ